MIIVFNSYCSTRVSLSTRMSRYSKQHHTARLDYTAQRVPTAVATLVWVQTQKMGATTMGSHSEQLRVHATMGSYYTDAIADICGSNLREERGNRIRNVRCSLELVQRASWAGRARRHARAGRGETTAPTPHRDGQLRRIHGHALGLKERGPSGTRGAVGVLQPRACTEAHQKGSCARVLAHQKGSCARVLASGYT